MKGLNFTIVKEQEVSITTTPYLMQFITYLKKLGVMVSPGKAIITLKLEKLLFDQWYGISISSGKMILQRQSCSPTESQQLNCHFSSILIGDLRQANRTSYVVTLTE